MADRKAVIKNADMSEDMQQDAVECATQALEKYNIEKDIAAYIKKVQNHGQDAIWLHSWITPAKKKPFWALQIAVHNLPKAFGSDWVILTRTN